MNKIWLIFFFYACMILTVQAQKIAIKSNLLYDATATVNLGVEYGINQQISIDLSGNYNGWNISEPKSWQHFMVQPEARYWLHECFNGHFVGLHALYSSYDIARLKVAIIDDVFEGKFRYDGTGIGAGISYGYHLYISPRLNIEFSLGVGYVHLEYDKYVARSETLEGKFTKGYFGPTKLGISIVYIIK